MTMRLSEAIRLGAMATEQGFGRASAVSDTAPCALGAARLAGGVACRGEAAIYSALRVRWPILRTVVGHPMRPHVKRPLDEMIYTLNDFQCWSRERIAEWVATVEDAQAANTAVEEPAVAVTR